MSSFIRTWISCLSAFPHQLSHSALEISCKTQLLGFLSHFHLCSVWGDGGGGGGRGRAVMAWWTGQEEVGPSFSWFINSLTFLRLLLLLSPRRGHPPSLGFLLVFQGWVFTQVLKPSGPVGWTWTPSSLELFPLSLSSWKGKWGTTFTPSGTEIFTLRWKQGVSRESDENQNKA